MTPKFSAEEKKQIGRRIQDARKAAMLTQEELAEKCDCSTKHLGNVERGEANASLPLAVRIGKALNTGVDYYLADISEQYADIRIDMEISEILKDCSPEGKIWIRDMIRRCADYEKTMRRSNS